MRFRLRSLVIATIFLPPLLASGWRFVEAALSPVELIYPGAHRVSNASWQQAKMEMEVERLEALKVRLRCEEVP
jgi:hypothetical protein